MVDDLRVSEYFRVDKLRLMDGGSRRSEKLNYRMQTQND